MKAQNIKDGERIVVTHGELAIVPVDSIPNGKKSEHAEYVASHSETGHHHMLTPTKGKVEITEVDGERYATIKELTRLWHDKTYDKHEEVVLAPGHYKLNQKTENDPFTDLTRRVFD